MKRYENCCILGGYGNPPFHARGCRYKENQPMHTTEPLFFGPEAPGVAVKLVTQDGLTVAVFRYSQNPRATREVALANAKLFMRADKMQAACNLASYALVGVESLISDKDEAAALAEHVREALEACQEANRYENAKSI